MSCICEKHKDELKSLSSEELDKKIEENVLKAHDLNQELFTQKKIVDLLIEELESRKCQQ
jgi:hypothetical protein